MQISVSDGLGCAQIMGDIVKPASKDAGGLVHGTVTDLKDQVSMLILPGHARLSVPWAGLL